MNGLLPVILGVLGVLAASFLVFVALQPAEFRIERAAEIRAPADKIFPFINDLRQFNTWNPWAKADPSAEIVYSGPTSGVGAAYEWKGRRSGAGRMQVATSEPSSKVTMNLDFTKPFAASNIAEFTVASRDGASVVTWAMTGRRPFSHKLVGTFCNMDRMVGGEFAKGLASLKTLAER